MPSLRTVCTQAQGVNCHWWWGAATADSSYPASFQEGAAPLSAALAG